MSLDKNHFEMGFDIAASNFDSKISIEDIRLTLKSRGYSDYDIFLVIKGGEILSDDRMVHKSK